MPPIAKFSIGTKVIILSLSDCSSIYPHAFVGKEAIVRKTFPLRGRTLIGVEIDGYSNPDSVYGCFWFPQENVEIYTEETAKNYITKNYVDENINKESEGNIKMEKNMKAYVICEINDTEDCSVGASYEDLKPGDIVVCDYKRYNGKLSVRRVVSLAHDTEDDLREISPACIILGAADISTYINETAKKERRAELKRQMIAQAKKYQEEEYWRVISETDPVMKAMYDEFKELED